MLKDKILMVTGASMGIGLATIKKFIKEGAKVIAVASEEGMLKEISDDLTFVQCDVTVESEIEAVCSQVASKFGKLDGLVTVCDKAYTGGVLDVNSDLFQAASKHIVAAPMLFTKYANNLLHKSENGAIIHDISVSALMMDEDALMASLNTSLVSYVRQASSKVRPVRINAAMYGLIDGHYLTDEKREKYTDPKNVSLLPAGRLGTPEDVANFNTFLISDKARYINSAAMQVDGGLYTMNPRSMGSAI